jgi:hypothetical protein
MRISPRLGSDAENETIESSAALGAAALGADLSLHHVGERRRVGNFVERLEREVVRGWRVRL